jgi:hypothetical protein
MSRYNPPVTGGGSSTPAPSIFEASELPNGGLKVPRGQRLHLSTDERWIAGEGHKSDLIRLQWLKRTQDGAGSKPALVWCDEKGDDKTAIISHDLANDPTRAPHRHISIETTMSATGSNPNELFTRMEFPYDQDICEIQIHSSRFTVNGNYMRIAGENGSNKGLRFCRSYSKEANLDANKNPVYDQVYVPRWEIRSDNVANTGGNAGDDFRLVRYSDTGSALDSPLYIKRSNGYMGIGATDPTVKLDINDNKVRLRNSSTPASATASGDKGTISWDANYVYVCVDTNTWKRSALETW